MTEGYLPSTLRLFFLIVYAVILGNNLCLNPAYGQSKISADNPLKPLQLDDGLPVSDALTGGLDNQKMIDLSNELTAGKYLNIHSVLIANQNNLIYEYYSVDNKFTVLMNQEIKPAQ